VQELEQVRKFRRLSANLCASCQKYILKWQALLLLFARRFLVGSGPLFAAVT
jgi:hypothetical protein